MKDFFTINRRHRKNKDTKESVENNESEENENENEDEFEEAVSEYKYKNIILTSDEEEIPKYRNAFIGAKKKKQDSTCFFDVQEIKELKGSNESKKTKHSKTYSCANDHKYNQITGLNITNYLLVPDEIRHKYTKPFLFQISKRLLVMKKPWRLPKNVDLQTNNIDHISNYIKVLERISTEYLNDPPINYYYRGLELYNKNVFANIDYLLKKVEIKNNEKNVNYSNLIKINKCYYDLNTFGKSPNNILYQSYVIWDIHGNNLTLAEEYDKYFESQILDYAYGEKEYPNLKYILNICSTILFWLNFNKKENFAIINYHKASSFILLILSCVMLTLDTSLTFEQLQETLYKSSKIYNEQNNDYENDLEMEREMKMKFHREMEMASKLGKEDGEQINDSYPYKNNSYNGLTLFDVLNENYEGANFPGLCNNIYFKNSYNNKIEQSVTENIYNYQTPNNSCEDSYHTPPYASYLSEQQINSSTVNASENEFLKKQNVGPSKKENIKRNPYINVHQLSAPDIGKTTGFYDYETENLQNKNNMGNVPNSWAFSLKTREIEKKNKKAKDHHFWIPFEYWKPSHKRYFRYFNELVKNKNKKIENNTFKLKSIIFSDYTPCTLSIEVYEIVYKDTGYFDVSSSSDYESFDEEEGEEEEEEEETEEKEEERNEKLGRKYNSEEYTGLHNGTYDSEEGHMREHEKEEKEEEEFKECFEKKGDDDIKKKKYIQKYKERNKTSKELEYHKGTAGTAGLEHQRKGALSAKSEGEMISTYRLDKHNLRNDQTIDADEKYVHTYSSDNDSSTHRNGVNTNDTDSPSYQVRKYKTINVLGDKNTLKDGKKKKSSSRNQKSKDKHLSSENGIYGKGPMHNTYVTCNNEQKNVNSSYGEENFAERSITSNIKKNRKISSQSKKNMCKNITTSSLNSKKVRSLPSSVQGNALSDIDRENSAIYMNDIMEMSENNFDKKKGFKKKWKMLKESRYSFFSSDDSLNSNKNQYYNFVKRDLRYGGEEEEEEEEEKEEEKEAEYEETEEEEKQTGRMRPKQKSKECRNDTKEDTIEDGKWNQKKPRERSKDGTDEAEQHIGHAEKEENKKNKNTESFEKKRISKKKKKISDKRISVNNMEFQKCRSKANAIYNILKKTTQSKTKSKEKMPRGTKSKRAMNDTSAETNSKGGYEYFLKCHSLSYNVISAYEKNKKKFYTIDFTHDAEGNPNEHIICGDVLILMGHKNVENCCTCFPCSYSFHTGFLEKGSSEIIEIRKKDIDVSNNYEQYIPNDMKISIILESATQKDALNAYKKYLKSRNKIEDLQMLKNFEKTDFVEDISSESEQLKIKDNASYLKSDTNRSHFDDKKLHGGEPRNRRTRNESYSHQTKMEGQEEGKEEGEDEEEEAEDDVEEEERERERERNDYNNINRKMEEEHKSRSFASLKTKGKTKSSELCEKVDDEFHRDMLKIKSETNIANKLTLNPRIPFNGVYTTSLMEKETKGKYNASNITLMISSFFGFRNREEKLSLNKKQKMIPLLTSDKAFTNPISLKDYLKRQFDIITKPTANIINFVKYHIVKIDQVILHKLSKITRLSKLFLKLCIKICLNNFFKTLHLILSLWGIRILRTKKIKDKLIWDKISEYLQESKEDTQMTLMDSDKTSSRFMDSLITLRNLALCSSTSENETDDIFSKVMHARDIGQKKRTLKREGSYRQWLKVKSKYRSKSTTTQIDLKEQKKKTTPMEQRDRVRRLERIGLVEPLESIELVYKKDDKALTKTQKSDEKVKEGHKETVAEEQKMEQKVEKKETEVKEKGIETEIKLEKVEKAEKEEKLTPSKNEVHEIITQEEKQIKIQKYEIEKEDFAKEQIKVDHDKKRYEQRDTHLEVEPEKEKTQISNDKIAEEKISDIIKEDELEDNEIKALEQIGKSKFFYAKLPNGKLIKLKIGDSTFDNTHDNMPLFIVESVDDTHTPPSSAGVRTVTEKEIDALAGEVTTDESKTIPMKEGGFSKVINAKKAPPPLPAKYKEMSMAKAANSAQIKKETNDGVKEAATDATVKEKEKTPILSKAVMQKGGKKMPPPLPPGFVKKGGGVLEKGKSGMKKCPMKMPPKLMNEKKIPEKRPLGIKLHWKLLPTHKIEGTVFSEIKNQETKYNLIDTKAVHKLFARIKEEKKTENKKKVEEKKIKTNEEKLITVLDRNRAQNIGILLRFPITTEEIVQKIDTFNLENMNIEFLQKVLHILPTKEEADCIIAKLQEENVKPEHFRDVERKLIPFVYLNKYKPKVEICLFSLKYEKMINEITTDLDIYDMAVKEVRSSVRLRSLLKAVLKWGNYVNYGINENEDLVALGFTLSSVLKLTEFKSSIDNSITSLHYITVTLCMYLPCINMSLLENDLKTVLIASKMSSEAVDILLLSLDKEIKFLKSQIQLDYEPYFKEKMEHILQDSETKWTYVQNMYEEVKKNVFSISTYLGEETTASGNLENIFIILTSIVNNFMKCYRDILANPKKYFILLNDPTLADEYYNIFSKQKRKTDNYSKTSSKKDSNQMKESTDITSDDQKGKMHKTQSTDFSNPHSNKMNDANNNEGTKKNGFLFKNGTSNSNKMTTNSKSENRGGKSAAFMLRMQLLKEIQEKKLLKSKQHEEGAITNMCETVETNGSLVTDKGKIHEQMNQEKEVKREKSETESKMEGDKVSGITENNLEGKMEDNITKSKWQDENEDRKREDENTENERKI